MNPIGIVSTPQTIGPAVFGSISAIGGSVWAAVVSPDVVPVVGGIGIGIVGIGWSIFQAGRDRRVNTLVEEIETLRGILKDRTIELRAAEKDKQDLSRQVSTLEGRLARIEAENGRQP